MYVWKPEKYTLNIDGWFYNNEKKCYFENLSFFKSSFCYWNKNVAYFFTKLDIFDLSCKLLRLRLKLISGLLICLIGAIPRTGNWLLRKIGGNYFFFVLLCYYTARRIFYWISINSELFGAYTDAFLIGKSYSLSYDTYSTMFFSWILCSGPKKYPICPSPRKSKNLGSVNILLRSSLE